MSYDDEDFRARSGDEEDDYDYGEKPLWKRKEGEEHEPPFGAIRKMTVLADQTTITINWQPPERETWNSCLLGYRVGIRRKNSSDPISFELVEGKYEDKETGKDFFFEEVEGTNHTHVFPNLDFETTYVVAVQVFNPWGKNPELEETEATTLPGRPIPIPLSFDHHLPPSEPCLESTVPNADHLFEAGRDMIKMQAGAWLDSNCPSDHLTVQGRLKGQEEWTSAPTRVEPRTEFNLNYLTPATWFHIKVQEINEGFLWL